MNDIIVSIIAFVTGGALVGVVTAYVTLRTLKPNIRILTAQEKKVIADAADVTSNALIELLKAFQAERVDFEKRIDTLEAEIATIKAARVKREEQLEHEHDETQARLKAALIESRDIRADNAEAQKQIIKLENTVIKMGKYIDTIKTSMQAANIEVPLNGELMDSVRRLQLSVEQRERLKAGK